MLPTNAVVKTKYTLPLSFLPVPGLALQPVNYLSPIQWNSLRAHPRSSPLRACVQLSYPVEFSWTPNSRSSVRTKYSPYNIFIYIYIFPFFFCTPLTALLVDGRKSEWHRPLTDSPPLPLCSIAFPPFIYLLLFSFEYENTNYS